MVLRGLGGVAIALPWLEAMTARAQSSAAPRRFLALFTGNGTVYDRWVPTGSETNFALSPILAPLEPYKSKLLVLDGIDMVSAYGAPVHGGMGHLLIGREPLDPGGPMGVGYRVGGISMDQKLAAEIGGASRFRSLELGVQTRLDENGALLISHLGPGLPVIPELNPRAAFDRLFSAAGTDQTAIRLRARRGTVLDAVRESLTDLTRQLGAEDIRRLDAHLSSVREVERRLDSTGTTCATGERPPALDFNAAANYPAVGKAQMDLVVLALACGLTRVASLMWSNGLSEVVHRWLVVDGAPIGRGHHELSHEADDNFAAQRQLEAISRWYGEQLAYLLSKMQAVQEGDRTLLDNSTVFWGSEISIGNTHDVRRMPFVLAGSCGGYFRTGRFLRYPGGTPHNKLLVSLCNAMGVQTDTFGDASYGTGPLSNLR